MFEEAFPQDKQVGGSHYKFFTIQPYEFISKNRNVSQSKAEAIVSTITEISRKLDQKVKALPRRCFFF